MRSRWRLQKTSLRLTPLAIRALGHEQRAVAMIRTPWIPYFPLHAAHLQVIHPVLGLAIPRWVRRKEELAPEL